MGCIGIVRNILGLYRDNGKEGNDHIIIRCIYVYICHMKQL